MLKTMYMYKVVGAPNKGIRILEDTDNWLYIAKLPFGQDNIWPNIEMIESYLGLKLELLDKMEIPHESKDPI